MRAGVGNSFFWRRLHSISGIVPIGAFLLEHFISNFEAFHGPEAYGKQVAFLNSLPFVLVMEIFFIWIPILYHGLYGIYIWWRGDSNVSEYPWEGNWLYTSQRWTGMIALIYMIQHTYYLRFTGVHLPTHPMDSFAKVQGEFQHPWMMAFYASGSSRRPGTSRTAFGCFARNGVSPPAKRHASVSAIFACFLALGLIWLGAASMMASSDLRHHPLDSTSIPTILLW